MNGKGFAAKDFRRGARHLDTFTCRFPGSHQKYISGASWEQGHVGTTVDPPRQTGNAHLSLARTGSGRPAMKGLFKASRHEFGALAAAAGRGGPRDSPDRAPRAKTGQSGKLALSSLSPCGRRNGSDTYLWCRPRQVDPVP